MNIGVTKKFLKALFLIILPIFLTYALIPSDPKGIGIGIFVLAIAFCAIATLCAVVAALLFRSKKTNFFDYLVVVANIVNVVSPFYWASRVSKTDDFLVAFLAINVIGVAAASVPLLKILEGVTETHN